MKDDLREAVARALCERHIRNVRRHDTAPDRLEAMIGVAIDCGWQNFAGDADAAIAAARPVIGEECAKVASDAHLHGILGEWDKGYNHAACNIAARIRSATR